MSMWQLHTAVEGWIAAHRVPDSETSSTTLSEKEKDEIWDWLNAKDDPYRDTSKIN